MADRHHYASLMEQIKKYKQSVFERASAIVLQTAVICSEPSN
jgi:N-dimethylarginine dimethylaminohydrolase